ncbi:MAG: gas vesicle protein [Streptosporangiales bacterium]|nr:gas vesicle protein [Streptosporangiales bacterium]
MTEPVLGRTGSLARPSGDGGTNLADMLERVLDTGIVIAGDIQINLLDIELLTIRLRLVVASVDKAKEMGIDWWERDASLSSRAATGQDRDRDLSEENRLLRERVAELEAAPSANGDGIRHAVAPETAAVVRHD